MSFFKNKLKFFNNKSSVVSPCELNINTNSNEYTNDMDIPLKLDINDESCMCCYSRNSYYNELLFSSRTTLTQLDNFYDIDNNFDDEEETIDKNISQLDIDLSPCIVTTKCDKMSKRKLKKRIKSKKSKRSKSNLSNYSTNLSSSGFGSCKITPISFDAPFDDENKTLMCTQRTKSSCEKLRRSASLKNLSFRFDNAPFKEFTPKIAKLYNKLPEHDKKILDRMVMKRSKEIAMLDDACVARQYWDKEKLYREQIINEQNEKYFNIVKQKRAQEQKETEYLLGKLKKHQEYYEEKLKKELDEKDQKVLNRLKNLELGRELKQCERKQNEFCKNLQILQTQHEQELDNELKRQDICNRLETRIAYAESMRKRLLDAYKYRLISENEIEQSMHAINYKETLYLEKYKHNKLKEEIKARDKRFHMFSKQKHQCLESSREQARVSSRLRELVRRSISPEISFTIIPKRCVNERPLSNFF